MGNIATFFMIGILMMFGGALGAFYGIFKANNKFLGFILSVFAVIIALVGFEIVKLLMDMNVFASNINIF